MGNQTECSGVSKVELQHWECISVQTAVVPVVWLSLFVEQTEHQHDTESPSKCSVSWWLTDQGWSYDLWLTFSLFMTNNAESDVSSVAPDTSKYVNKRKEEVLFLKLSSSCGCTGFIFTTLIQTEISHQLLCGLLWNCLLPSAVPKESNQLLLVWLCSLHHDYKLKYLNNI